MSAAPGQRRAICNHTTSAQNTNAFVAQAALSFGVAFRLATCVRDIQEDQAVSDRLDEARVEKLPAEHDPFRQVS